MYKYEDIELATSKVFCEASDDITKCIYYSAMNLTTITTWHSKIKFKGFNGNTDYSRISDFLYVL